MTLTILNVKDRDAKYLLIVLELVVGCIKSLNVVVIETKLAVRYRLVIVWGGPGGVSHNSGSSTSSSECGRGTGPHFHQNNSLAASFGIAPLAVPLHPATRTREN